MQAAENLLIDDLKLCIITVILTKKCCFYHNTRHHTSVYHYHQLSTPVLADYQRQRDANINRPLVETCILK